ncbi:Cap protein [Porcine associated porprismacovirus 9]|uniref:Cap protein n=1 Tax=Porcine associated porprismacovirus 9 TaxID=2170125 RepID=A0A076VEP0_9VIRU|nr:Cap protein [Porcine associated porprismacovirus 9]AIK28877.1 Cap protein [Porcine associated porprismacovirus 9]
MICIPRKAFLLCWSFLLLMVFVLLGILLGFFAQFRKFRYAGAKVTFIPAATLPADPLQVSYEAGEPTIDPRDLLNPILHKGIHGDALGNLLEEYKQVLASGSSLELTKTAAANYMTLYYQCLTDPSFKKSGLRQGFVQNLYPLVYSLGTNRQIMPSRIFTAGASGLTVGDPSLMETGKIFSETDGQFEYNDETWGVSVRRSLGQAQQNLKDNAIEWKTYDEFTTKPTRLGWLDTLQIIRDNQSSMPDSQVTGVNIELSIRNPQDPLASRVTPCNFTTLPKIPMYMCFLPPAYKTEMYFRIVIQHYFEFKEFRSTFNQFGIGQVSTATDVPYDWLNAIKKVSTASVESEKSLDIAGGDAELTTDGVL